MVASSALIDGTISARGFGRASGGSINLQIFGGGTISGSGILDVAVLTKDNYNYGGGGRISLTGP